MQKKITERIYQFTIASFYQLNKLDESFGELQKILGELSIVSSTN